MEPQKGQLKASRRATCVALAFLLMAGLGWPASAASQRLGTLTIKVTGACNAEGTVGVAVFADRRGFPEDVSHALRAEDASIDSATLSAQVTFSDLPVGSYAISVRHDENKNGRLDRNFLRIPREGYGASNNAAKRRRTPAFDDARFSLDTESQTVEIKLVYWPQRSRQ